MADSFRTICLHEKFPERYFWFTFLLIIFLAGCEKSTKFNPVQVETHTKPWTRWWWMGSSVTKVGITQHLEAFAEAGMGGVEIVPIYGVKGDEPNFIEYLSDEWIGMLLHTLREAERLDLGVDMTLGSGWPYGGPWIREEYAARRATALFPDGEPTGQRVKRAAPGAEGLVVDHLDPAAMGFFLSRFDSLLTLIKKEKLPLRAIFNDSYEVYGADWTRDFKNLFRERRGYDFPEDFLFREEYDSIDLRYWQDYHLMINDLVRVTVGNVISNWCKKHKVLYRYQAHGAPSNLLDLYGDASIPETECFGSSKFNIPLVDYDLDYNEDQFARPHPLIYKFASSPAHILGKPLVSSETGTWLANHFKVSLSQVKPQIDELFVSGINHIFYHGIPYSPFENEFPGRQFYASTNFGPNSSLWAYMNELNEYIRNCQLMLQNTTPDNDILLYYPVYDLWHNQGFDGNLIMQSVHNPEAWLFDTPFGMLAQSLLDWGYAFDYISDEQIELLAMNPDDIPANYKVLIIPPARFMPSDSFHFLALLQNKGMKLVFLEKMPSMRPGVKSNEGDPDIDEGTVFDEDRPGIDFPVPVSGDFNSISNTLADYNIRPEVFPAKGLQYIRKAYKDGYLYLITNLDSIGFDGYCPLVRAYKSAEIYDPLSEQRGKAQLGKSEESGQVRLQIEAGQSIFLITYNYSIDEENWVYHGEKKDAIDLNTNWTLQIEDPGNDDYLKDHILDSLTGWSKLPFSWISTFTGTGTYQINFEIPEVDQKYNAFILDLGDLRYMAEVTLNGHDLGAFWSVPFRKTIPKDKFESSNTMTVKVTNLDANQVVQLDRAGIPWKNYYDINFVDIRYEPFDASQWEPMPSGLPGPVRLIPVNFE